MAIRIDTITLDLVHLVRAVTVTDEARPGSPKGVRVVLPWALEVPTVADVEAHIAATLAPSVVQLAQEVDDMRRAHATLADKLADAHVELEQIRVATQEAEALALAKAAAVARAAQELAELDGRISAARADAATIEANAKGATP